MTTEEIIVSDKSLPKYSYHAALSSWFVAPSGSVRQIGSADKLDLVAFLAECSRGMKQKITRRDLLAMLQADSSAEARWFVLNEFRHYRVNLPLYASAEEALQAAG